jgi:hypothetical protein
MPVLAILFNCRDRFISVGRVTGRAIEFFIHVDVQTSVMLCSM